MTVTVLAWSSSYVVADVDGIRTRIRVNRNGHRTRWLCAACGDRTRCGHCPHTAALAETPADPNLKNGDQHA